MGRSDYAEALQRPLSVGYGQHVGYFHFMNINVIMKASPSTQLGTHFTLSGRIIAFYWTKRQDVKATGRLF